MEEGLGSNCWQFKDVLEKLLDIVTVPISQALNKDKVTSKTKLYKNVAHLSIFLGVVLWRTYPPLLPLDC
jgi:hypothetical protein